MKFQLVANWIPLPLPPLLATSMLQVRKTKRCSQNFREASGVFQRNFNCSKSAEDRAIFEDMRLRGQGQGLDFRGQGRPRRLHLCILPWNASSDNIVFRLQYKRILTIRTHAS